MKKITVLFMLLFTLSITAAPLEIKVWPNGAAESNEILAEERIENGRQENSKEAVMFIYSPAKEKNNGAALVICPGGGYSRQAIEHEGHQFAQWLAENGITGIVLKYRLPNGHHAIPSTDARQAIRIVRQNAKKWGINPQKVGISGFSAGGHLAATVTTRFDETSRPDFSILFYPVVTLKDDFTHRGSRNNLLGKDLDNQTLVELYSNELHVGKQTPPTLIFFSDDDKAVPTPNGTQFYNQLKKMDVTSAMYIFPTGGHGWGMRENFAYHNIWKTLLLDWLKSIKMIP